MNLITRAAFGPAVRRLLIDFKDASGQDRHVEDTTLAPPGASDAALVESVKELVKKQGGQLSALWQIRDGQAPACLFMKPGFLEETVMEMGLSVPADPVAAIGFMERATGICFKPVNLDELTNGWRSQGKHL